MSAMISLNNLKNDNKNNVSQNVSINVHNNETNKDIKVSYSDSAENKIDNSHIFDYYDNILPNVKNDSYNNLTKMFAQYIDILNTGRYKKEHGQNVLFKKDFLNIIQLLAKTYITDNHDCNIKMYIDENVGCFANDLVIDSVSCSYKDGFIDVFTKSAEIVNILQMMKIDKSRTLSG